MTDGFRYTLEEEKIREYMKLTPEEKLTWLDEIFRFSEEALSPNAKKIRARLRGDDSLQ
jgi:hypothetical protein